MDGYQMTIDRNKPGRGICISASVFTTNSTSAAMNANKRKTNDADCVVCEPSVVHF
jgi:hypothetical protein